MSEIDLVAGQSPDESRPATRYSVPALEKGFEILELLAGAPNGMSLTEIAGALSRSTGELYRILQYLEWRDYIVRSREGDTYTLSLRLFHLAHKHPPVRSLVAIAAPIMEELTFAAGQSCHLCVLSRTSVTIVAQVDSPLPIRYSVRLGAQLPAWESSSGILLCAYLTEPARRAFFAGLVQMVDDTTLTELAAKIEEVRAAGFERRQSLRIPGITNISCPVRDRHGHVAAALTVPYLSQRSSTASIEEVTTMLDAAAARISADLGYRAA